MTALLTFEDVACRRGGRTLFEGLGFAVSAGAALLVTGPNGVGKSSLVRIAAGLLRPAAGRVAREAPVALLTEASALDPERTVNEALCFWAAIDGRRGAVGLALEALGIAGLAGVPVRMLSTGQRRRAALARVVASGAPLWLLDEPASGLDAAATGLLEALIARHREDGGAALVTTHQSLALPEARTIALAAP